MASRIVLFAAVAALVHSKPSGQLCGGKQTSPDGSFSETIEYKGAPLWGSLQQTHDARGFSSPITYKGGADLLNANNHGLSGSFSLLSGKGGEGSLKGTFPISNNPIHKVDGFGQIERNLNKNLNSIGPETNSFGINYKNNQNDVTAFAKQAQTHGNPATKTVGASIPIVNSENHLLSVTGQNIIGQQQKLGVNYENKESGFTASLSGVENKGNPARGTAGVSIPIVNAGDGKITLEGQTTFGHGMKPDSQVGLQMSIPH